MSRAHSRCWLEVDPQAVRRNALRIRTLTATPLVAVVKANGYGHGAAVVARAALEGGARSLAVATAHEALELRAVGIAAPIQVLGSFLPHELDAAIEARVSLTLHEPHDLERVRQAARRAGRPLPVHIKLDVGMHRHGMLPAQALELLARAQRDPGVRVEGLMTHLPCAAGSDLQATRARVATFAQAVAQADAQGILPPQVHAAATAAALRLPEARFGQVRVGIGLLGLDPAECLGDVGLEAALSLRVAVTCTRKVAAGEAVGYGGRWVAPRDSRLALLGAGYGDGLPYAWTRAPLEVLISGQRCPLVGSVMMDYMAVDVTGLARPPQPGDVATLVGRDGNEVLRLEDQAASAGLIPYAFSCGLGGRLKRVVAEQAISLREAA